MKRPGIIGVGCAVIAGVLLFVAPLKAYAQTYPPPTPSPTASVDPEDDVANEDGEDSDAGFGNEGGEDSDAGFGNEGGEASVLGTTVSPDASVLGATDGVLPSTGLDIALLVLWAAALIAVGSTGVFAAWRRVQTTGVSFARNGTAALPPPEIPRIDTSGFVPYRSSKAAEQTTKGKRPRRST